MSMFLCVATINTVCKQVLSGSAIIWVFPSRTYLCIYFSYQFFVICSIECHAQYVYFKFEPILFASPDFFDKNFTTGKDF